MARGMKMARKLELNPSLLPVSQQSQGKVERQGQGKTNVRLRQSNHNHNHNYNLMGFDTIEINLVFRILSQPHLNPNLTQPNITKVGVDIKKTLVHHSPPTWNSMSAISQLLLTQF